MTDCRIYVACLASYNSGRLYGKWIDADQDADAINEEIRLLLKGSPYPNVTRQDWECDDGHKFTHDVSPYQSEPTECPHCASTEIEKDGAPYPSAEEYAIHDSEGFGNLIGEYTPISEVVQIAEALDEHGDKYRAIRSYGFDHDEALEAIEDQYEGEYDSLEDWAEERLTEQGLFNDLPDDSPLRQYFDFERYAHDMDVGGEIIDIAMNGTLHIFRSH